VLVSRKEEAEKKESGVLIVRARERVCVYASVRACVTYRGAFKLGVPFRIRVPLHQTVAAGPRLERWARPPSPSPSLAGTCCPEVAASQPRA
jgi:hypothetical protein